MTKKTTIKIKDIIYPLIAIMIFCSVMQNTLLRYSFPEIKNTIDTVYKFIRIVVFGIGMFHFVTKKQSVNRFFVLIIFLLIFIPNFLKTKYFMFFDMFFIPIVYYDSLDYKRIISTYLYTMIFSLIIILVMYLLNLFPNSVFTIYRNSKFEYRESFGFGHPNGFARHIFIIALLLFLKKDNNYKMSYIVFNILLTIIIFITSRSITVTLLMAALVLYMIYLMSFNKIMIKSTIVKLIKKPLFLIVPIAMIASYMIFSKGIVIDKLSEISNTINSRYIYSTIAINKYGFHLFGINIELVGKAQTLFDSKYKATDYLQVDNFFIYLALTVGILAIVFWIVYYTFSYKKSMMKNNRVLTFVLTLLLVYSFTENTLVLFSSAFIYMLPYCNYETKCNTKELRNKNE